MQTIPLDRIQDVTVKQGLLQQYFGIRNIEIQTAGSGGPLPEVSLVGPKNALAVRDAIMSYRDALVFGGHRGSSIPTASDPGLATRQSLKPSASEGRDIDLVEVLSELTESMRRIEALITEAIQKVN
uniref:YdbS-like PH domain-containing protein n=1 Tax=Globisporangium ultimum (strain ATCC 200006 / CBS 805.95 / DAOM BR144) TaxID=431595 RepID=K3WRN2_GLOUD